MDKCYVCGKSAIDYLKFEDVIFFFCKKHNVDLKDFLKDQGWEDSTLEPLIENKGNDCKNYVADPMIAEIERFKDLYLADYSTILLKRSTISSLKKLGNKSEKYDDIVLKLIEKKQG